MIIVLFRNLFSLTKTLFHYNFVIGNNNVNLKLIAMKKITLIIIAVLMGLALNAQETFYYGDLTYKINDDGISVTLTGHVLGCHQGELTIPAMVPYNGNLYAVTTIGTLALHGCYYFTGSLIIPNTVTEIGHGAFSQCGFDGTLTIGCNVRKIGSHAFSNDNFTGSLILPESLDTIGYLAFAWNEGFNEKLVIPSSVDFIGHGAFAWCGGFTEAFSLATEPPTLEPTGPHVYNHVFDDFGCSTVTVPCGSLSAYENSSWHGDGGFSTIVDDCDVNLSVWDGSVEPWDTIHTGTANDPILIENAAQLAYMSQLVYCSQNPKYYKLTTDIDLDNRLWNPIGYISVISCPEFNGYFDGDNHTIYNPSNTLFYDTYNGYIKNLTTRGSVVYREDEYYSFGLITYWAPLVENCHNYCDIIINAHAYMTAGSIAGECGSVINCSNHGTITINANFLSRCFVGAISGEASAIEECYNTGDLNIDISSCNNCKIGGVSGLIFDELSHSYNTGDIMVNCENSYTGGITGDITENNNPLNDIFINSCYNAGNINATNIGGIIAKTDYENITTNIDNCYYINTIASINDYGTAKSNIEMKTQEFVDLLNANGDFYAMDIMNVNKGYPVFERYYSVEETDFANGISVYPNPAKDVVNISFSNNAECRLIDIYSIDGRLMKSQNDNSNKINISNLTPGLYLIKVRMNDGKEFTEKIVVK